MIFDENLESKKKFELPPLFFFFLPNNFLSIYTVAKTRQHNKVDCDC